MFYRSNHSFYIYAPLGILCVDSTIEVYTRELVHRGTLDSSPRKTYLCYRLGMRRLGGHGESSFYSMSTSGQAWVHVLAALSFVPALLLPFIISTHLHLHTYYFPLRSVSSFVESI